MKIAKTIIATISTALVLGVTAAHANDSGQKWIAFGNSGAHFDVRAGSLSFEKGSRTGETYATVIGRQRLQNASKISLVKYAVALSDCKSGYGKLNFHDLNSGEFLSAVEWVDGAGTIASNIADVVCLAAAQELADQQRPAAARSAANSL